MALTPPQVAKTARSRRMTKVTESEEGGFHRYTTIVYGGSKPARSVLWVQKPDIKALAKCTCTCAYFQFHYSVVNALVGSSPRVQGRPGALPLERNPKMKPGMCPHLYLLAGALLGSWIKAKRAKAIKENAEAAQEENADRSRYSWLDSADLSAVVDVTADDFGLTADEVTELTDGTGRSADGDE